MSSTSDYKERVANLSPQQRALLAMRLKSGGANEASAAAIKRLVAYVVPEEGQALAVGDLRSFLSEELPEHMVPWTFVFLKALPVTANGKLDRKALPAPMLSPDSCAFAAPRNSAEQTLARIWASLLGVEQVGIHDNFFELGGDSILSIQVIARAREEGIHLAPRQFFQHQTIAQLAEVARLHSPVQAEQQLLTGPVPLTPIQQSFFEWGLANPHHYNQALMLELSAHVDSSLLEQSVAALLTHHDALRLRFEQREGRWFQSYGGPLEMVPYSRRDLSSLRADEQRAALHEHASHLQASINLNQGSPVRVAEYNLGDGQRRLLMAIHHLAVDGVSWRILLEDLESAYEQLAQGQSAKLPAKTTSFRRWAERLEQYSQSEEIKQEAEYWLKQQCDEPQRAAVAADAENSRATASNVTVWLSEDETQALLQEVPSAYQTQINEVLLTALAQAFKQWSGSDALMIELEGHGREDIFEDIDLTRTVGWFTTTYPLVLRVESDQAGEAIKQVKEQVRAIPKRGIGYGVARYMSSGQGVAGKLSGMRRARISFNYLGQFDQMMRESRLFKGAAEGVGATRSADNERQNELEVNAMIVKGRMRIDWACKENAHVRERVEELASKFAQCVRLLINHCQSPEAGGYTPSDFPEANLSQENLDRIIEKLGKDLVK